MEMATEDLCSFAVCTFDSMNVTESIPSTGDPTEKAIAIFSLLIIIIIIRTFIMRTYPPQEMLKAPNKVSTLNLREQK